VSANGNFVFNKNLPTNSNYAVTLGLNPSVYNCNVQNGSGKVSNSNINNISVVCSALPADIFYNSSNGSYYRYVKATGITWQQAKDAAEQSSFNGMQGYLATVTTLQERNFIDQTVFSGNRPDASFIGGSDAYQEGVWRWVTGPEGLEDGGKGLIFFDGTSRTDIPTNNMWVQGISGGKIVGDSSSNNYLYMYSWWDPRFNPWNNSTGSPGSGGTSGYLVEYSASYRPIYLSGTLSGLDAGQTITLSNNDNDSITLSANGAFNFTKPIPAGSTYSVSIQQEPDYKLCKVTQGSGTSQSNVNNVSVECLTPVVSQFSEIYIYYAAGTAVDLSGNVYLVYPDAYRSRGGIDKITKFTPAGVESIVAGGGQSGSSDGNGEAASFNYPMDVAVSASGILYVADTDNNLIRKITPAGDVTTVAGSLQNGFLNGADKSAKFSYPRAVALDSLGNVYVSDSGNFRIRKIMPDGVVSTFAGSGQNGYADGNGEAASFSYLDDIAVDASDNMYVSDRGNNKIRKITPAGVVSTFASVEKPTGIAVDKLGNLYILSSEGGRVILKITPQGKQNVLAGRFQYNCYSWLWGNICPRDVIGEGRDAMFKDPKGIAVDESGNLYVANEGSRIRKITFVKSAP
jgi:hypothetical protein